jgi:polyisoprenoid-binding protein YceI
MGGICKFDPNLSRFTVQAFASGMLSFLGHNPTFAVRDFTGTASFEGSGVTGLRVELSINAGSLQLLDQVKPADREDMEGRMRREVLEVATCPRIAFHSTAVSGEEVGQGRYRVRISGQLSLHGVSRLQQVEGELLVFPDGVRLRGERTLRMSEYGIRPVTALGGTLRLKDELKVSFDLAAEPEGT